MKRNKLLLYIFFLYSTLLIAQNDGYLFKVKHHPETEYHSEIQQTINVKTKKKADKEILRLIDSLGGRRIQKLKKTEGYSVKTLTKEKNKFDNIPVNITAFDFTYKGFLNNERVNDSARIKTLEIKGFFDKENKISIEDILIDNTKTKQKNEYIRTIENRELLIPFPNNYMEINDILQFDYEVNYKIPIDGQHFYHSKCNAKLLKVRNGIGYFKISSPKTNTNKKYSLSIDGRIEFDIENNLIRLTVIRSHLNIVEAIDGIIFIKHDYSDKIKIKTEIKNTSS